MERDKAAVMVSARRKVPNFIVSSHLLTNRNCDLFLSQKLSTVMEHEVQCIPEDARANPTKLKLPQRIELPQ